MIIKGLDKYKTFGLRADWIQIYFDDAENFWTNQRMGKLMFDSFKNWGREIELLDKDKKPAPYFAKLAALGADNLNLWGMFFVNLAYNSPLINFFVKRVDFDFPYDNVAMKTIFGD